LRVGARAEHVQEAVLAAAEIRDAAVDCRSCKSGRRQHNPHVVVGALEGLSHFRPRVDARLVDVAKRACALDKLRKPDYELVFVGVPVRRLCVLVRVVGVAVLNVVLPVELPERAGMQVHIQSLSNDVHPSLERPAGPFLLAGSTFEPLLELGRDLAIRADIAVVLAPHKDLVPVFDELDQLPPHCLLRNP
jgi:hypothetical protein